MMLCEQCGVNPANVHITQISPSGTQSHNLCEECARGKGIALNAVQEAAATPANAPLVPEKSCPACGTTQGMFREKGRLGCGTCYDTFAAEIDKLLLEVHGSNSHEGKRYSRLGVRRAAAEDIKRLRTELERAVRKENFEEAARLRDTINALSTNHA